MCFERGGQVQIIVSISRFDGAVPRCGSPQIYHVHWAAWIYILVFEQIWEVFPFIFKYFSPSSLSLSSRPIEIFLRIPRLYLDYLWYFFFLSLDCMIYIYPSLYSLIPSFSLLHLLNPSVEKFISGVIFYQS